MKSKEKSTRKYWIIATTVVLVIIGGFALSVVVFAI